jgi:hypothetical protein
LAEIMYAQATKEQTGQETGGGPEMGGSKEGGGKTDDDVVDADFEEVK